MVDTPTNDSGGLLDTFRQGADTIVDELKSAGINFNRSLNDSTFGMDSNDYNFDYKVFPEDLTSDNTGHYMVININVPVNISDESRSAFQGAEFGTSLTSKAEYSKVDTLRFGNLPPIPGAKNPVQREALAIRRGTRRIKESIALFMPSSLVYSSQNKYEEISMTAIAGNVGKAGMQGGAGLVVGAISKTYADSLKRGAAGKSTSSATGNPLGTVSSIAGYPINPRVEVLYSTTPQREFVFEILLAPRSETESIAAEQIIKALRYHAAPEIDSLFFGFTFIPPAEFDITFFNKGVENNHIPRINTCVLERIEVDYAPTGVYATFTNGYPVATRLSLGFREIEIIHKERILRGF